MLILLVAGFIHTTLNNNVNAQKFRIDYMWAQAFKTFYRLHDVSKTWEQARQICEAEGTSLLVPSSLDEIENLKLLMSNMKAYYTAIYVGVHDKFARGDYVTINGNSVSSSFLQLIWNQGSPKNTNNTEHCVIMTREGLFDDRPCSDIYPFVCKIMGQDVRYNSDCDNFDLGYIAQSNGKCYKFHDEPVSWHDAYMICKSEAANLVIVNSQDEATLISNLFSEHVDCLAPDPNILHVGFSDLMYQYQYRTIFGQSLDEAGYSLMNPIYEDVSVMKANRCGSLARTGYLRMTNCNQLAMYVCEKKINHTNFSDD